jgi:hypothetical protein
LGGLFVVGEKIIIKTEPDNEWIELVLEAKIRSRKKKLKFYLGEFRKESFE